MDSVWTGGWYARLHKPSWTPAPRTFGAVWTALYLALAYVGALLIRRGFDGEVNGMLWCLYLAQSALNLAWVPVFAVFRSYTTALVIVVLLDMAVWWFVALAFCAGFWVGALVFAAYGVWLLVATALNAYVSWHN